MDKFRPASVNICGICYTITYVDNPAEVDLFRRDSLWGQIDHWTRTIRVYDNGRPSIDVWDTILHECLHGLIESLKLKSFKENHDDLEVLSLGLTDMLTRNGWLKVE